MKKTVLLKSPILTISGYGEHARLVLNSLREYSDYFDIYILPITWGHTSWNLSNTEENKYIDERIAVTNEYISKGGKFDISVQVTIPGEFEKIAEVNIGVTAGIETDKISPLWVEKTQFMDRIITISNHAKHGFVNTKYQGRNNVTGEIINDYSCRCPVDIIPYPSSIREPKKFDVEFDYDFNYLVVAQWSIRKNLENTIGWFLQTFKDKEVGLVLKLNTANNSIVDQFRTKERLENLTRQFPNKKCKIHLIHGTLKEEELSYLYTHPKIKCLINLAHGESYGLSMFEAAQYGLPVISPNWGGQLDFLYAPVKDKKTRKIKNKPMFAVVEYDINKIQPPAIWDTILIAESNWCFPKEISYKDSLLNMYKNYDFFLTKAKKLQKHILKEYTKEKIYKMYAESIYGENLEKIDINVLPKVSTLTSVFKAKEWLREWFIDMERQTIFKANKLELVIVHPRKSPHFEEEQKIILEYKEKYPDKIVYEALEEDPGVYGCWNKCVELSSGEYLSNANTDDRKHPECLEAHAKELYMNPEVSLVYADSYITHKPNETFESNSSNGERYNFEQFSVEAMIRSNLPHCMPVYRKSLHDKHGMFDASLRSPGDWDMFTRFALGGEKFKKLSGIYGLYFFNPVGISTNKEMFEHKRKEEMYVFKKNKKLYDELKKDGKI